MKRRTFIALTASAAAAALLPGTALAQRRRGLGRRITGIDSHAHVFVRGLKLAEKVRYVPDYDATVDDFLNVLDANGMSHGVLVQPSFLGTDNSFLLESLRKHPNRLRGIAVVPPDVPKDDLTSMASDGVVGIRLNLVGLDIPDFSQGAWPALLKNIADLGWQVEVHRQAVDLPKIVLPLLSAGVNVVVDHFGLPDRKLGVDDPGFRSLLTAGATRRVWVKISGFYRNGGEGVGEKNTRAAMPLLKDALGLDRLVWGSDWPHTQFEKTMDYKRSKDFLDVLVPDPKERRAVLVDTPASLFKFTERKRARS